MFDEDRPFFLQLGGKVYVCMGWPENMQCTAQTTRRKRCNNTMDHSQTNGFSYLAVPGGYVEGYDYDDDNGSLNERGRRYLEQRCELHFDSLAPSATDPEWERFAPAAYHGRILSEAQTVARLTGGRVLPDQHVRPNAAPSPDNDGVPIDVLRPVLERRDLSFGAGGLWSMLVSFYWSCETNRTVQQLRDHRPQDADETEALLGELAAVGLVEILDAPDGQRIVSINPDFLGTVPA